MENNNSNIENKENKQENNIIVSSNALNNEENNQQSKMEIDDSENRVRNKSCDKIKNLKDENTKCKSLNINFKIIYYSRGTGIFI